MKMSLDIRSDFDIDDTGFVHVHANGNRGSGGINVRFREAHSLNVLQSIPDGYRATKQVAELLAVAMAARQATSAGVKKLRIHTESKYILFCVRKNIRKWRKSGWINANGDSLSNKRELIELDDALQPLHKVKWMWKNFYTDPKGYVHVYTDGACRNNGKLGLAAAGIGVYFENNHALNISQRVPHGYRQTNQVAEILAVKMAAMQATSAGVKKLKIQTDSKFVLNCVNEWMEGWMANGWVNAKGNQVVNKEELIEMNEALQTLKIKWKYVPAHNGIYGNVMADKFARAGIAEHRGN